MSNPILVVGDRYVDFFGNEVLIKSVDLQNGVVAYIYSDGLQASSSFNTFHQTFMPYTLTPGCQKILDEAALLQSAWAGSITKCECGLDKTGVGGNHSSWCPKHGVA